MITFVQEAATKLTYETVFQVTQKTFHWQSYGIFLLMIATAASVTWLTKRDSSHKWKSAIAVVLVFILSVALLLKSYLRYLGLHRAYAVGAYSLVEGPVEDFRPMPFEGHQEECFSVKAKRFCYSDFAGTPAFNNTASHGGPIKPGLRVRIAYIGNDIVRLEIARN